MIRIARAGDVAAIRDIYAPSVTDGAATFETTVPAIDTMQERLRTRLLHYPWLVWEEAGEILAYAYAGRFRERAAYDWIAETSIYVRTDVQRRGIARQLYGRLLEVMCLQGVQCILLWIAILILRLLLCWTTTDWCGELHHS